MDAVEQYQQLRRQADQLQREADKAAGSVQAAMRVLQDQGHATIEDAEEALLELETKAEKAAKAADVVAKKFLMEWGDDIADFQAGA
jgi:hypothetical protein